MATADDHTTPAPLAHNLPCSSCDHDHGALPCDWCLCGTAPRNGIDTALGGRP